MAECKTVFSDSSLLYEGPPTLTLLGLEHLNGVQVTVWADGQLLPVQTVQNGRITLPREASRAIVGVGYVSTLETMPVEMEDAGSLRGRKQRVAAMVTQHQDTYKGEVGISDSTLEPLAGEDVTGLYTGDIRRHVQGGTRDRIALRCRQALPAPFTILSTTMEMEIFQ